MSESLEAPKSKKTPKQIHDQITRIAHNLTKRTYQGYNGKDNRDLARANLRATMDAGRMSSSPSEGHVIIPAGNSITKGSKDNPQNFVQVAQKYRHDWVIAPESGKLFVEDGQPLANEVVATYSVGDGRILRSTEVVNPATGRTESLATTVSNGDASNFHSIDVHYGQNQPETDAVIHGAADDLWQAAKAFPNTNVKPKSLVQ
jgi:hypothetical protein